MPDTGDTKGPWGAAPPTLKSHAEALSATFAGQGFALLVFGLKGDDRRLQFQCVTNVRRATAAAMMRAYAKACDRAEDTSADAPPD